MNAGMAAGIISDSPRAPLSPPMSPELPKKAGQSSRSVVRNEAGRPKIKSTESDPLAAFYAPARAVRDSNVSFKLSMILLRRLT